VLNGLADGVKELLEVLVNLGIISKIDLPDEALNIPKYWKSFPILCNRMMILKI
jgi:hypothetical protein